MIVNGVDLATRWGLRVETPGGLTGALALQVPITQLAGSLGDVVTSPDPQSEARLVTLPCYVKQATNAALKTALEELLDHISIGPLEVRTPHYTDRMWLARFVSSSLAITDPTFATYQTEARGTITLRFTNIFALERLPRTYGITTTGTSGRVYLLLGTGPSRPVIQIRGPATNPKLTLYDAFGVKIGEMNFTITLATDDYLGIDCWTRRITKSVAGTVTAADSTRKLGDDFFNLLPRYGSADAGRHCLMELSAGIGLVRVRRSWKL